MCDSRHYHNEAKGKPPTVCNLLLLRLFDVHIIY